MNDIILVPVNDGLELRLGATQERLRVPLYGVQNCLVPMEIGYRVSQTARFICEVSSDCIQIKGVERILSGRYFIYSDFQAVYVQSKMR